MYQYIFIYVSMLELYFWRYLWDMFPFFLIYQDAYLNVNSLYIKFLHMLFLPDVASASIACFKFVSVVLSVTFTMGEDDEANKVQFVLIYPSGELTETLNFYCITNNTLPFVSHIICIYDMHSYIFWYVNMLQLCFYT